MIDELNNLELAFLYEEYYDLNPAEIQERKKENPSENRQTKPTEKHGDLIIGDASNECIIFIAEDKFKSYSGEYLFLEKVLLAANLSFDQVALFINGNESWKHLEDILKKDQKTVFCFGVDDENPLNEKAKNEQWKSIILHHPNLTNIMSHQSAKKALWSDIQNHVL